MRLLVIEDDRDSADYLVKAFREVGHVAEQAFDAFAGDRLLRRSQLAGHFGATASAIDGEAELLHIQRLRDEIENAFLKKFQRGL